MWEAKFPTACSFTGYSGCDMLLMQEKQEVGRVMAVTYKDNPEKGVFEGFVVVMEVNEYARIELPVHIEIYIVNELGELKLLRLEDVSFPEGFETEKSYPFIAQRVSVEEYHQIPIEEEV